MAENALQQTDEAIHKFTSQKSLPEPIDCKPRCHYCCYNLPLVTPPETLLIGQYLEQTCTDKKKTEITNRIDKILTKIEGISPYEVVMIRHELPCIFLEDEMCLAYEVRPVVCRTCTSTSAEHCKMIFETRNHRARLRCYQPIRDIFQSFHSQLIDRCREMGCQPDASPLAEGMRDYLKHPRPIEAWLKGEMVFQIYA